MEKDCRRCGHPFATTLSTQHCDTCRPIYRREANRARQQRWAEGNQDRVRANSARYNASHREEINARQTAKRSEHRDEELAREALARARRRRARAPIIRPCGRCGAAVTVIGNRRFCDSCIALHRQASRRAQAAADRKANPEGDRARQRRYRERHREELRQRNAALRATPEHREQVARTHSETRFGGLREAVLKRDGHRCQECGATRLPGKRNIVVHHRDFDRTHNVMENLVTLCRKCHRRIHPAADSPESQHKKSASLKRRRSAA